MLGTIIFRVCRTEILIFITFMKITCIVKIYTFGTMPIFSTSFLYEKQSIQRYFSPLSSAHLPSWNEKTFQSYQIKDRIVTGSEIQNWPSSQIIPTVFHFSLFFPPRKVRGKLFNIKRTQSITFMSFKSFYCIYRVWFKRILFLYDSFLNRIQ